LNKENNCGFILKTAQISNIKKPNGLPHN